MNKEELKNLLMQKDVDIKTLAQIAKLLKSGEADDFIKEEQEKTTAVSSKPEIGFKVDINYPDFTITKTTKKTTKQLVFMVSQNSYFIRYLNRADSPIEQLSPESWADFTSGMPEVNNITDFWTNTIKSGKRFYEPMMRFAKKFANFIKMGICKTQKFQLNMDVYPYNFYSDELRNIEANCQKFPALLTLVKEYYDKPVALQWLSKCGNSLQDFIDVFGFNNTRDFLNELSLTVYNIDGFSDTSRYGYCITDNSIRHKSALDYKQFKEYCLYEGVRMGYRNNFTRFISTWKDDLNIQEKVFGYVKEKYPKNLQTHHDKISDMYDLRREIIDAEMFAKQVIENNKLTWSNEKFVFITPQTKEEFIDEAHQQANCLATYIKKFTEGRCNIIFMRQKETPAVSEVTIEVVNGEITQALQASNRPINEEQDQAVAQWAKKFDLKYDSITAKRARAAN